MSRLVNVVTPSGRVIAKPIEEVPELLKQGYTVEGAVPADARAVEAQRQQQYGEGFANKAQAFAEGVIRGAVPVIGDALISGIDPEGVEGVEGRRELAGTGAAGEIVGGLGASLAPGGTGGLARILSKTPTAIGTSLARRAGARATNTIARNAIEGAVEGGLFATGQELSHAVISDDPVTVESVAVAMGSGAALGFGVGGSLGAISSVAGKAKRALAGEANPLLNPKSAAARELSEGVSQELRHVDQQLSHTWSDAEGPLRGKHGLWGDARAQMLVKQFELRPLSAEGQLAEEAGDTLVDAGMREQMGVQRALDADFRRGKTLVDEPPGHPVDPNTLVEKVPAGALGRFDDTAVSVRGADEALDPNATGLGKRGARRTPRDPQEGVETFVESSEPRPQTLLETPVDRSRASARTELELPTPGRSPTPRIEGETPVALGDLDGAAVQQLNGLRTEWVSARAALAKHLGPDLKLDLAKLSQLKPKQALPVVKAFDRAAQVAQKVGKLADTDLRLTQGAALIERLTAGAPEAITGALGRVTALDALAMADMLGVPVEDMPLAGSAAHALLQLYLVGRIGSIGLPAAQKSIGAKVIRKAGEGARDLALHGITPRVGVRGAGGRVIANVVVNPLHAAMRLASGAGRVKSALATGLDAFVKTASRAGTRRAGTFSAIAVLNGVRWGESDEKDPQRARRAELTELTSNPERLAVALDHGLAAVRASSLPLGFKLGEHFRQRMAYLRQTMPTTISPGPFSRDVFDPSPGEIESWAKRIAAAEDPVGQVLDGLQSRELSLETVETVKELYPALYQEMQVQLVEKIAELRAELPYQDRLQLSLLFGVPVEPSMHPEVVDALQAIHQAPPPEPQGSGIRGTPKPPAPTKAQQLQAR